jgi:hypothetical protein
LVQDKPLVGLDMKDLAVKEICYLEINYLLLLLDGSVASRTNFFPIDEKSMQKNPRLRPVLLMEVPRLIIAFRTGQGRF